VLAIGSMTIGVVGSIPTDTFPVQSYLLSSALQGYTSRCGAGLALRRLKGN